MQLKKSQLLLENAREYTPIIDTYPTELLSNCRNVVSSCKKELLLGSNPHDLKQVFTKLRLCLPMAFSVYIDVPIKESNGSVTPRYYNIKGDTLNRWYPTPTYNLIVQPPLSEKVMVKANTIRKLLKSKRVNNNDNILLF